MSSLEQLAPDQRAVVALVLQQGRSYDEIAALLGLPVAAVRARAQAGLAALAPANGLPGEVTAPLADYLLGQQPAADAVATRGLLSESAPARAWATDVAGRLADVAKAPLPEIPGPPADAAGSDAAAPADVAGADEAASAGADADGSPATRVAASAADDGAARDDNAGDTGPPPASKLGGVLLIVGVVVVVAVVLFLVLRGGDDEEPATTGSAAATASPTPTATPQVADEIRLRATGGGKANGTMTVFLQDDQLLFALQAENVPPSGEQDSYAIWFTGPGSRARRLGFTNPVGDDGQLGIQGPSEKDLDRFPQLYSTYANVVVSRETDESAKRPTQVILSGKLPVGR